MGFICVRKQHGTWDAHVFTHRHPDSHAGSEIHPPPCHRHIDATISETCTFIVDSGEKQKIHKTKKMGCALTETLPQGDPSDSASAIDNGGNKGTRGLHSASAEYDCLERVNYHFCRECVRGRVLPVC